SGRAFGGHQKVPLDNMRIYAHITRIYAYVKSTLIEGPFMSSRDLVLSHPVRTAIGTFNGTLKAIPATELGATVVRETLRRSGLDPARVGSVVMGNVIQAGNRMNPARQAAINGGVPVAVPAMTVNRVCGSGAQAIASAAQEIWLGHVDAA